MKALLQQALDALKAALPYINTDHTACRGDKCREPWCSSCNTEEEAEDAAQEGYKALVDVGEAIAALQAAISAPEPEPVAWREFDGEGGYLFYDFDGNEDRQASWNERYKNSPQYLSWLEPLYLHPAARQPLTEKAIYEVAKEITQEDAAPFEDVAAGPSWSGFVEIVRAIEKAHGIGETK